MSGEKWTPGPWIVDFDLCDEEGPLDVPEVNGRILDQDNCVVCQASTEANALLIAAAPDLYDALQVIEHALPPSKYKEIVSAALKKARGES